MIHRKAQQRAYKLPLSRNHTISFDPYCLASLKKLFFRYTLIFTTSLLSITPSFADSRIYTEPLHLYPDRGFELLTRIDYPSACGDNFQQTVKLEGEQIEVRVSLAEGASCVDLDPQFIRTTQTLRHRMPALPAGNYTAKLYLHDDPNTEEFRITILDLKHPLTGSVPVVKIGHETPAPKQLLSGIGLIRGWACVTGYSQSLIEYQIDELEKQTIPLGSSRPDTKDTCNVIFSRGSTLNGYGAIFNWNSLSPGQHRFRLWQGDQLKADHEFFTANIKSEFMSNLSHEFELQDFPDKNDTSTLRWSEANQNFIIINTVTSDNVK